ncbi:AbrB/MazE/SpoVT family DNA-binding domain-containing protein [Pseudonocardia acaciae]|uniref:AbrB/MazE/SpoVT family DNA-binding domain-containing protein n=1 Tax=Pseudonocardia acaciae TaxID=551276 RepID=UPI000490AA28|nr:AbrB/MazE/SpoVT family DNA-binding domain-containing protein [Pseudonocardia acaciae]
METLVKHDDRRVRTTKVSRKNQVTLPVAALRAAQVAPGDVLRVEVEAPGVFRLVRQSNDPWWELFEETVGIGGITTREELEEMRDEWER